MDGNTVFMLVGWGLAMAEAYMLLTRKPKVERVEVEKIVEKVIVEPEIPPDIHELALAAENIVERVDNEKGQSGEWKFHQAYAAMRKKKEYKSVEGWKLGLAIQLAVAERRISDGR